jgi:hypothetical protein
MVCFDICFDNSCFAQMINLKNYPKDYLDGIYVEIIEIIDNNRLLVKVIESETDLFIGNRLIINLNYIDKELKRTRHTSPLSTGGNWTQPPIELDVKLKV